jgi:hypothetical protein
VGQIRNVLLLDFDGWITKLRNYKVSRARFYFHLQVEMCLRLVQSGGPTDRFSALFSHFYLKTVAESSFWNVVVLLFNNLGDERSLKDRFTIARILPTSRRKELWLCSFGLSRRVDCLVEASVSEKDSGSIFRAEVMSWATLASAKSTLRLRQKKVVRIVTAAKMLRLTTKGPTDCQYTDSVTRWHSPAWQLRGAQPLSLIFAAGGW